MQVKKFKDFDPEKFINGKYLKEAAEMDMDDEPIVKNYDDEMLEDPCKAVYEDKFLSKISGVVMKRLKSKNIGNYNVYHDIIYLNGVPGVLFAPEDASGKYIVCCRDVNRKSLSVFNSFEIGSINKAAITYSTEKLGFLDMIDQMVEDLQNDTIFGEGYGYSRNGENMLLEAYGQGWSASHVKKFESLSWADKEYLYGFVTKFKQSDAINEFHKMVVSKNAVAVNIVKTIYGTINADPTKNFQSRCIISIALTVACAANGSAMAASMQQAVSDGVVNGLIREYKLHKGAGPAISASVDAEYSTTDVETVSDIDDDMIVSSDDDEERLKELLKEDLENYKYTMEGLADVTGAMCSYVKNGGVLNADDASIMSRRAVLLTGKGGIGKTYTVKKVLSERNMINNKDYIWLGSESLATDRLYKLMYTYNGKLMIFDDTADIFEGKYMLPFWKQALQTDIEDANIGFPHKESGDVYDDRVLKNRQRRYFVEMGKKSEDEKNEFYASEMKKHGLKWSKDMAGNVIMAPTSKTRMSQDEADEIHDKIDREWEMQKENIKPLIPAHFNYTGCVIIITNQEREVFKKEVGASNWTAIRSRFKNFDVSPMAESLWAQIKEDILKEYNDESIPDENCTIPRDMTDEFIEEVEKLISDPMYGGITRRTVKAMGLTLRGAPGRRRWKNELKDELKIE